MIFTQLSKGVSDRQPTLLALGIYVGKNAYLNVSILTDSNGIIWLVDMYDRLLPPWTLPAQVNTGDTFTCIEIHGLIQSPQFIRSI